MAVKVSRRPVPPPAPAPRKPYLIVVLLIVVLAAGVGIGYLVGTPDEVEKMQISDLKRDAEQIKTLTDQARQTVEELDKILPAMAEAGPPDVAVWQETIRKAVERHADAPSGMTETNVARGGFRSAVNALSISVDLLAAAQKLPEADRAAYVELATRQRTLGITIWSVAATQLDQLNVEAGYGHQHAYLSGAPGEGGMHADEVPEGSE
ncbi:hypothetical protein [Herbidospora cretacea]|uniref:hypothetical protein n=1 Tax=Herbidospora cretacea TaxID=28444 RepID=UPI000773C00C|nr:hypothetical protein [Herbidospora cretacea]